MSTASLGLYHSMIKSRTLQIQKSLGLTTASRAFLYLMLDVVYPTKSDDNSDIITDGGHDRGVDAIYLREDGAGHIVDIVSCKYRETERASNKNFEENELPKLFSFVADLLSNDINVFKSCSSILIDRVKDIQNIFNSGGVCRFRIVLISNGKALTSHSLMRLQNFAKSYPQLTYEQIEFWGVVNLLINTGRPNDSAQLRATDRQIFDRVDGDIRGIVANVDAMSLLDAITEQQTGNIKRYIFDENIRIYLGDDGGHNKQIINSAISDDTYLFWYQNNGITIVCDSAEYQPQMRNPVISIGNFQIVNGAQTCHALHRAAQIDRDRVSGILLLVKIFVTSRQDVYSKVAIATNSQARITPRDLHANDQIQRTIGQILNSIGLFYERKKNEHIDKPNSLRIDSLKLGQCLLSYVLGEPERSKTQSDDIFGLRYNDIFGHKLTDEAILNCSNIYKELEKIKEKTQSNPLSEQHIAKDTILTYGFWHIIYTVSLFCKKDGILYPELSKLTEYFDRSIALIDVIINKYKTMSNYDMFRSPRLREKILSEFSFSGLQMEFEL